MLPASLDEQVTAHFVESLHRLTGIPIKKLQRYGTQNNLLNALEHPHSLELTTAQLLKVEQLNAFLQSHRVLQWEEGNTKRALSTPEQASGYFLAYLSGLKDRERFMVAFLDQKNQIIETRVMSEGGLAEAPVYPRNILKAALNCDSSSIIMAHNHPSGIPTPSPEDVLLTERMVAIFEPLNIRVLDHIVIGGTTFASLAELGQMPKTAQHSPNYEPINGKASEAAATYSITPLFLSYAEAECSTDEWER
ncbi:JAB domain-containing protein [Paenibacillus luteus]|uniref:JAB domain-containing protein n=1 Tax=Paenibacillus luteus TaxID=2545753 RepID=UPI001142C276|nr:JAB domain-containing protein [Paenibacillus luteus]